MKAFKLLRAGIEGDAMLGLFIEREGVFIRPCLENAASRIRPGSYLAVRDTKGKHRYFTLIGYDVHPDERVKWAHRFACEFHPANMASQLDGCIALGREYAVWLPGALGAGKPEVQSAGVSSSRATLDELLSYVGDENFWLTIEETPPLA